MHYLIYTTIYWLAFWLFYRLLLERERFFALNRLYLVATFALGLLLPLIPWGELLPTSSWSAGPVVWLNTISVLPDAASPVAKTAGSASFSWGQLLEYGFLLGAGWTLVRLVRQFWQLSQLIRTGRRTQQVSHTLIQHPAIAAPYSWFHFLFWPDELQLSAAAREAIIVHEQAHIDQGHSWDVLLLEIIGVAFWWNPLWYAYRRSLTEVHEYLADAKALTNVPKREYGQLLLRQSLLQPELQLVHTFHTSQLKKRIIMMTKSPSSVYAAAKYALFLPFLLLLVLACEDQETQDEIKEVVPEESATEASYFELVDTVVTFDPATNQEDMSLVKRRIYEVVDQMPVFGACADLQGDELMNCSNQNLFAHIYEHVQYPKEAHDAKLEGMALTEFIVDKNGKVTDVRTLGKSTEHEALNAAARQVVAELPDFRPGQQDGQPVNVKMVLPIRFALN